MTELNGKTAFVTGASRGIGAAIAVGLAEHGADIVICDLARESDALAKVKAEVEATGRKCWSYDLDVTDKAAIEQVVADATEKSGGIDVLVNNAGILKPTTLENLSEADWDAHFDVNAKGVLLVTNAVLPQMRERKAGRIINIASIAGRQGVPTQGHYAATKATAITLTRVYSQEVGMDGIMVNAICPGPFLTPMNVPIADTEEGKKFIVGATALKRWGELKEIQGAAIYLASDAASYTTGAMLSVDGGWTAQ